MFVLLIMLFVLFVVWVLASNLKAILNPVKFNPRFNPDENALALHQKLLIADMHADSLLYRNNLLVRSWQGHVDLPRLIEGNVAFQVFTCVSKYLLSANLNRSGSGGLDLISALAVLQGWPAKCRTSLLERALYQAEKLKEVEKKSNGKLKIIHCQHDLQAFMDSRSANPGKAAALLGIEGAQVLEGKLENLDRLYQAGYRLMSLTHFFDNETGGSRHGLNKEGLTPFGREVVYRMQELNMIIDLAHASERMMDDVLEMVKEPVIVSHTGVQGICKNNRNLSDVFLYRIAKNNGLVGIGFWDKATGSGDVEGIARSIRYTVDLIGVKHVGIGSDFDGSVTIPFDASQIAQLTGALLKHDFTEEEIMAIMGENFYRLAKNTLLK
jgi:microsomal dipeptidase-like Zn-dependent dipeptidase